ncbi:hypothetical protein HGRIS_012159 [Hohenbuehelia grisea]|uniref:Uncharacterized protein n=1 Tax=Hohenbuehelia grisea TaxID=104357 RepID=A0ABR3IRE6_9AGAR
MMPSPSLTTATLRADTSMAGMGMASPYYRSPNLTDFQVERPHPSPSKRASPNIPDPGYEDEMVYRESVARLLAEKDRPTTVSGRIPVDPSHLVLFFRSKSGITHSLDFPIDVDYNTPPALDVLIAACRPHPTVNLGGLPDRESLYYPPNLPLTTTLEIANHPILEAVRNTLFPELPTGHYLTVERDKLEVVATGGRMGAQLRELRADGRSATIVVTLPVRFRGGALVVRDPEGREERFGGHGGKNADIEWTAFTSDCEYEVETVIKGCRLSISYAVHLKTFGPSGVQPDPLITPSGNFLDSLAFTLNKSRGRKIAFYVMNEHNANPADVLAESLVPELKGGDSLLYHALKLYKLTPELHWAAGGYIWPVDSTIQFFESDETLSTAINRGPPAVRGAFGNYQDPADDAAQLMRVRVESSGALSLADAEITLLTDWGTTTPTESIGKTRFHYVSRGELERLLVYVLMVVYIP